MWLYGGPKNQPLTSWVAGGALQLLQAPAVEPVLPVQRLPAEHGEESVRKHRLQIEGEVVGTGPASPDARRILHQRHDTLDAEPIQAGEQHLEIDLGQIGDSK